MTTEIESAIRFTHVDGRKVIETYEDTFSMEYDEVEEALIDWLRKNGQIDDDETVMSSDIPIILGDDEEDDDELVFSFDLTLVRTES